MTSEPAVAEEQVASQLRSQVHCMLHAVAFLTQDMERKGLMHTGHHAWLHLHRHPRHQSRRKSRLGSEAGESSSSMGCILHIHMCARMTCNCKRCVYLLLAERM